MVSMFSYATRSRRQILFCQIQLLHAVLM
uniref:Wdr91 n=1 Tax=Arundo donax TaxID=35708 RepID=A0A0A9EJT4_ARUDO